MPKKSNDLSKERGDRVKRLLRKNKMYQTELADALGYTPEHLSAMLNGKRAITDDAARAIAAIFPQTRYEWILAEDDFETKTDLERHYVTRFDAQNNACLVLLESSLREVCLRENMPVPVLDNIPELLFLEAQLRDFSDALMWNYVKHKEHSHVWSFMDQLDATVTQKRVAESEGSDG